MRTGLYTEKVVLTGSTDPQAFFVPAKSRIDGIIFEKRGVQSGNLQMGTSYTPPVAEKATISDITAAVGGGILTIALKSAAGTKTATVEVAGGETAAEVAALIAAASIEGWGAGTVVEDGDSYSVEFVSTEYAAVTGSYSFNGGGTGITTGQPTIVTPGADRIAAVPEIPEVAASAMLTFVGPIADGETVSVGGDVYEFSADGSVEAGHIAVNISTLLAPAEGSVAFGVNAAEGNQLTVGDTTYMFTATADAAGEVAIGGTAAATAANLENAINGTDTINAANVAVVASNVEGDATVELTARASGSAGNSITLSGTLAEGITISAMADGDDATAAEVIPVLLAAEQLSGTAPIAMTSPSEGVVVVTADVAGTAAESILVATTCANGSFNTPNLEGGVDYVAGSAEVLAVAEIVALPKPTAPSAPGEIMLTIGTDTAEIALEGDETAEAVIALILGAAFSGYTSSEAGGVIRFTSDVAGVLSGKTYAVSYGTGVTASVTGDGLGADYIVTDDVLPSTALPTTHMETKALSVTKSVFSMTGKTPVLVKVDTANCLGTLHVSYEKFA